MMDREPDPPRARDEMGDSRIARDESRVRRDASTVRADDIEPYVGLLYVVRLFKIAAAVVVVALLAEVIAGIALEGTGALLTLTAEVVQGVVLAAILWGAADLTILFVDAGHDLRAARVLLGRLSAYDIPPTARRTGRDDGAGSVRE